MTALAPWLLPWSGSGSVSRSRSGSFVWSRSWTMFCAGVSCSSRSEGKDTSRSQDEDRSWSQDEDRSWAWSRPEIGGSE